MKKQSNWSYIEFVIIIVILGAVAIKIGPQLTQAGPEHKICKLIDGLQEMRSQLDLYRARHEGQLPPTDSFERFRATMITKDGQYGPYIKKIPANPFNNLNTVRFDGEPAGIGMAGWRLDTNTGLFQADDSEVHARL